MKRYLLVIVTVLLIAALSVLFARPTHAESNTTFITIERSDDYRVVYERTTKVMYVISSNGEATVMCTAKGYPQKYEE